VHTHPQHHLPQSHSLNHLAAAIHATDWDINTGQPAAAFAFVKHAAAAAQQPASQPARRGSGRRQIKYKFTKKNKKCAKMGNFNLFTGTTAAAAATHDYYFKNQSHPHLGINMEIFGIIDFWGSKNHPPPAPHFPISQRFGGGSVVCARLLWSRRAATPPQNTPKNGFKPKLSLCILVKMEEGRGPCYGWGAWVAYHRAAVGVVRQLWESCGSCGSCAAAVGVVRQLALLACTRLRLSSAG